MDVWIVDIVSDDMIELTAPNGKILFLVTRETAEMIGEMLVDASVSIDDTCICPACYNAHRFNEEE